MSKAMETATLGGGCFWCVEAIYQDVIGVHKVVSGYAGGAIENPTYEQVCSGTTGHAEVVQIVFDPTVISFEEILFIFWRTHDPTTLNRQGNDVGTQYRSVIYYHDEQQKSIAERSMAETEASDLWAGSDCDGDCAASNILRGGSVSSELFCGESVSTVLHLCDQSQGAKVSQVVSQ